MIQARRAIIADTDEVFSIADSRNREKLLQRSDISKEDLSRDGFLFYPLAARSPGEANYSERILGSNHFWVAEENSKVVAFCMAYTFAEMRNFSQLTANDRGVLEYFLNVIECDTSCVYLAQTAVLYSHKNRGIMRALMDRLKEGAKEIDSPMILGEIAQRPELNEPSTNLALKTGFRMIATRRKKDSSNGQDRVSGTFAQTLPKHNM